MSSINRKLKRRKATAAERRKLGLSKGGGAAGYRASK